MGDITPFLPARRTVPMRSIARVWNTLRLALLGTTGWLSLQGIALAQQPQPQKLPEASGGGPYVVAYGLVIMCIALGIMIVCRPGHRRDRAKVEQFATEVKKAEAEKA